jgi:indolepyruvate ferredoxin oxidoreductase
MTALRSGTKAVLNTHVAPTAAFILDRDLDLDAAGHSERIAQAIGKPNLELVDAQTLAERLLGEGIASNMFMIGFAYQRGWLPVGREALEKAIELNGVSVEMNTLAFAWGRMAAHDLAMVRRVAGLEASEPVAIDPVERRATFLTDYQNAAYAERYRDFVARVKEAERRLMPGSSRLTNAVANNYFKLLAYKDEYEVARLHSDPAFMAKLNETFEPGFTLDFNMAPPLISKLDPETGHRRKRSFGPWMLKLLNVLARGKALRGTALDLFGYQVERKRERALIADYEVTIGALLPRLSRINYDVAVQLASLPDQIRGFGHVKEKAMDDAKEKQLRLLGEFSGARDAAEHSAA